MKYKFDRVIDRFNTASVKWDLADKIFHGSGLLPMWVADMDFQSPPEVIDALVQCAAQGIFGYTAPMPSYFEAILGWFERRHGWNLDKDWIRYSPGVVPGLNILIQTFTEPGQGIIIQKPVYYPFMKAIENNDRLVLNSPLVLEQGIYRMDLENLRKTAALPEAKLMILCSPHNPVGRVWTEEELIRVGEICSEREILIISDEIHCDLIFSGRHIPFASIRSEFLENSITCVSPSKTFNLAGLHTASIIIADSELRGQYTEAMGRLGIWGPNHFGASALESAYNHGGQWLNELLEYLKGNLEFLKEFIGERIPAVKVIEPEATYLVWLDFRKLSLSNEELKNLLINRAGVALDHGYIFGSPEGDGFERINIACPRPVLEKGLGKIEQAINGHQ